MAAERQVTHAIVQPGLAQIIIAAEPVNTMTLKLWQALTDTFNELESDPAIRAVIFVSGLKRDVFTAGNDIGELYAPRTSLERYYEFWVASNHFLARVYRSRLFTVAAIRGACPAGGCCLSMCCDVRLMTPNGHIGLNEVALGIAVPPLWMRLMARLVGEGTMERLCCSAQLLSPQEALQVGLVDEVVEKADLVPQAVRMAAKQLELPDGGRVAVKTRLRSSFSHEWEEECKREPEANWAMLTQETTVAALGAVLKRLSGNKKSKL